MRIARRRNRLLTLVGPTGSVTIVPPDPEPGGDTTAPTLSSPTGTQTGQTTATLGVTTNEANGTLYSFVSTSATPPSAANLKTGTGAVFANSQTITTTGAKTASATGLTAATAYYAHWLHRDAAGNDSTIASSSSFTTASGAFVPTSLTGLDLWLDADDAGSITTDVGVSQWNDKSGNSRHAVMATGANQPVRVTGVQNGKAVLRFDAANDNMTIPDFVVGKLSLFVVAKNPSSGTNKSIIRKGSANPAFILRFASGTLAAFVRNSSNSQTGPTAVTAATNTFHNCELHWDGTTISLLVNAGTASTIALAGTAMYDNADTAQIGANGTGDYFQSDLCEIVMFNRELDAGEKTQVRNYLTAKWGL